jgi:hypothetical protein
MIFITAKIDNARKILMEATSERVVRNELKLCSPACYKEQGLNVVLFKYEPAAVLPSKQYVQHKALGIQRNTLNI